MNDKISRIIKEKCDAQAELMKVQASDTSREVGFLNHNCLKNCYIDTFKMC